MEKAEHTPLPWHKDIHGHIGDSKGTNIASTWTTPDENNPNGRPYKANAAFIVTACNAHYKLLNAAKQVMEILGQYGASAVPHLMDTDDNAGQALRDAIAEATGEA